MPGWLIALLIGIAVPVISIAMWIFLATKRGWDLLQKANSGFAFPGLVGSVLLFPGIRSISGPAGSSFPNAPTSIDLGWGIMQLGGSAIFFHAAWRNHKAGKAPK